jgi:hypothetical protein
MPLDGALHDLLTAPRRAIRLRQYQGDFMAGRLKRCKRPLGETRRAGED